MGTSSATRLAGAVIASNRAQVDSELERLVQLSQARRELGRLADRFPPRALLTMAVEEMQTLQALEGLEPLGLLHRLCRQHRVVVRLVSVLRHLHPPGAELLARPWIEAQLAEIARQASFLVSLGTAE